MQPVHAAARAQALRDGRGARVAHFDRVQRQCGQCRGRVRGVAAVALVRVPLVHGRAVRR